MHKSLCHTEHWDNVCVCVCVHNYLFEQWGVLMLTHHFTSPILLLAPFVFPASSLCFKSDIKFYPWKTATVTCVYVVNQSTGQTQTSLWAGTFGVCGSALLLHELQVMNFLGLKEFNACEAATCLQREASHLSSLECLLAWMYVRYILCRLPRLQKNMGNKKETIFATVSMLWFSEMVLISAVWNFVKHATEWIQNRWIFVSS